MEPPRRRPRVEHSGARRARQRRGVHVPERCRRARAARLHRHDTRAPRARTRNGGEAAHAAHSRGARNYARDDLDRGGERGHAGDQPQTRLRTDRRARHLRPRSLKIGRPDRYGRAMTAGEMLLEQIRAWADARSDIRAVVMTGSTVRTDGSADSTSDLDIELFTTTPELYASTTWTSEIRPVWVQLCFEPDDELDYRNRLTIFEGGQKVDFRVASIAAMERMVSSGVLDEVYERGYRVLLDKDGITDGLRPPALPAQALPSEAEYQAAIEEFWFEAWHIPKYAARDDLW